MLSTTVDGNHGKDSSQTRIFLTGFSKSPIIQVRENPSSRTQDVARGRTDLTNLNSDRLSLCEPAWKLNSNHIVMHFSVLVFYTVRNTPHPPVRMWSHNVNFHSEMSLMAGILGVLFCRYANMPHSNRGYNFIAQWFYGHSHTGRYVTYDCNAMAKRW